MKEADVCANLQIPNGLLFSPRNTAAVRFSCHCLSEQTALAAVGCMVTWSEVYKELSAADAQASLFGTLLLALPIGPILVAKKCPV